MTLCPILWADGFGSETLTGYGVAGTDANFSGGGGRGGRNAVNVGAAGGEISWSNGSTYARMIVSVAMKNNCALQIWADTAHELLRVTRSGLALALISSGGGTLWTSPSIDFSTYTQVSLGIYFTGSGSMTATLILNGASTVFSGSTTSSFGAPALRAVMTSDTGSNAGTFCDFVVQGSAASSDTSLGDVACGWILPTGSGANTDWTPTGTPRTTNNTSPSGNQLVASNGTEAILPSCDLTLASGTSATLAWDLWTSQYHPGNSKVLTLRLRRTDLTGTVLASTTIASSTDSQNGHQDEWASSYVDGSPTDGHYVLTAQETTSGTGSSVYCDTRAFSLTTNGSATGTNWQAEADIPPDGDTSYVASSTPGDKDSYAMSDLSASAVTVYAVVPKLYVRKTDAGARTIEPLFHISGTDYAGSAQGMGTGYGQLYQVYSVSPATSSAWTVSEVNGLELGVELAS